MANRMSQAMAAAVEYHDYVMRGDVVSAGETRRTIDSLVGRWEHGVWSWPSRVVAMARGQANTQVIGYSPAIEVQS